MSHSNGHWISPPPSPPSHPQDKKKLEEAEVHSFFPSRPWEHGKKHTGSFGSEGWGMRMLCCRACGEHESHGSPRQIRADSIHQITASHCTQRAEINREAGGAWGVSAVGQGYFSPCVSSSAELDRVVYPQCPTSSLRWSKESCGSWPRTMHWRWVQRTEACAFPLLHPKNSSNNSTRKSDVIGKISTSHIFPNSCFLWYFHITTQSSCWHCHFVSISMHAFISGLLWWAVTTWKKKSVIVFAALQCCLLLWFVSCRGINSIA